jgi:large subunit ribosomal protein L31
MKANIHPTYHQASVTCACGNKFSVGSTMPEIKVEICNLCHPFFTGQQKFIDTAGRVDRFKARVEQAQLKKVTKRAPKVETKAEDTNQTPVEA